MAKQRHWNWRNWPSAYKSKKQLHNKERPGGITVKMKRHIKTGHKGKIDVLVKISGKWIKTCTYNTEDEACIEVAHQLELQDLMVNQQ